MRWSLKNATLLLLFICAGCSASGPRPNVLFIVIDTLRQDHLGCYGHDRDTSPFIDRLAGESARFNRAYSTAPWTQASVASMITGLYPSSHGVTSVGKLPQEVVTLAEMLKQDGYATAGYVSHMVLADRFDFDQGFDEYDNIIAEDVHDAVSSGPVTRWGQEALRRLTARDDPFFLFLHYFDPHYNYIPHPEYGYAAPGAGRLDGTQSIHQLRDMMGDMTEEEITFIRDLYDEEIRYTDAAIGRLLDTLKEVGAYENTLIVVTADHGEEFLTHGWIGHTRTLYEELIRIPLIIREPGASHPREVDGLVSLTSLTPTVLDIVGVDGSQYQMQAESLLPLLSSPDAAGPGAVFSEVDFIPIKKDKVLKITHKKTVITKRYKIIRDDSTQIIKVFDVEADRDELVDLAMKRPDLVEDLIPLLDSFISISHGDVHESVDTQLTEEELKKLRSLGYVGD